MSVINGVVCSWAEISTRGRACGVRVGGVKGKEGKGGMGQEGRGGRGQGVRRRLC